jgi:hypothetical protein
MPRLNLALVSTEPGSEGHHPFTPPAGWTGNGQDYIALMRDRYREIEHGQRMVVTVLIGRRIPLQITGPFAEQAREVLEKLRSSS